MYFDYNATTPLDHRVLEDMMPCMTENWGNPSSPYSFGNLARTTMENARIQLAECIGCDADEIIFTSSGTESDNLAIRGAANALRSRGNHIITTTVEHHAVLNTCKALEADGFQVTRLPVDTDGTITVNEVEAHLRPETILITIMHANNETGVLHPVEAISSLAGKRGILFHTDAVQTAGKTIRPLCEIGADLISFSAHKLYGPKGTAALFIRRGTIIDPLITGGPHERGFRAGTENVAGIVGFSRAMTLATESAAAEHARLLELRDRFERLLKDKVSGYTINGENAPRIPTTSSISFDAVDGESIVFSLDLRGIYISTGSACSTGDPDPSHVLLAMRRSPKEAQGSVRVSFGRFTQEKDIAIITDALAETVGKLRAISSI
jgi:cysteine desulfurase